MIEAVQRWDNMVLEWWQNHHSDFLTQNFLNITSWGSTTTLVVMLFVGLSLILATRGWCSFLAAMSCVAIAFATETYLKYSVDRPRPHPEHVIIPAPHSPSFPSGHSTMSMVTFVVLAASSRYRTLIAVAVLLSVLVGMSRMYLGVHYFSDVVTGWTIGLVFATIYYRASKNEV